LDLSRYPLLDRRDAADTSCHFSFRRFAAQGGGHDYLLGAQ
jgi:hypothetical protein